MWSRMLSAMGLTFLCGCAATGSEGTQPLRYTMNNIQGEAVDLSTFQGKVVLIVNVASKCGFTPQYAALEYIYQQYKDQGLVILGFPCNDFLGQEPGTNEEIKTFCSTNYGVTFDMFAKISVRGDDAPPLYQDLTSKEKNGAFGGAIKWNFTKFLIGRDGKVVDRFAPTTKPDAPKVVEAIEAELNK